MVENTVKQEAEPKPKLHVQWGPMTSGLLTAGFALGCGGADLINNAIFGWQKGGLIAAGFVIAAIGLMGLPAKARGLHDVPVWLMVAACGALSLFAGYKNHTANQRNFDLAQAAITTRYNQAQDAIRNAEEDARQAKAEIAGIAEMMGSEELQRLHDEAKARAEKESSGDRGGCGRRCRAAEDEAKGYLSRIASARAKEDAQGRLEASIARMNREKASAPAAPKQAGESDHEEMIMAFLLLLVTVIGATFFERGFKEIKGAISWEAPKRQRVAAKTDAPVASTPAARGLAGFIGLCKHGEMVPIKEAHAALERWWKATGQKGVLPAARTLSSALEKAGFEKQVDRNKRSFFAVKAPEAGLRLVAGQDA